MQIIDSEGDIDQVVLDSAGDCKSCRKLLKQKYPDIAVSACSIHCIHLIIKVNPKT
jgi:hypothetical protein